MKFTIQNKIKSDLFVALFQMIKNCSTTIHMVFTTDHLHIQGMDISQVCLFNLDIHHTWFSSYVIVSPLNICINTEVLLKVLSMKKEHDIEFSVIETETDYLYIDFVSSLDKKSDFNKHFKLSLNFIDDYNELSIPTNEYEADITMLSKQLCDLINQMSNFSDDIHDLSIVANNQLIEFKTEGVNSSTFVVVIEPENLIEYAIIENTVINLNYSLKYLHKLCITNKISNQITISISNDYPMKIYYDLGEQSHIVYYLTPKISE